MLLLQGPAVMNNCIPKVLPSKGKLGTNTLHSTKPVILIIFVPFFGSKQLMSCQRSVTTHQRVLGHAAEKILAWWNMPPGGGIAK